MNEIIPLDSDIKAIAEEFTDDSLSDEYQDLRVYYTKYLEGLLYISLNEPQVCRGITNFLVESHILNDTIQLRSKSLFSVLCIISTRCQESMLSIPKLSPKNYNRLLDALEDKDEDAFKDAISDCGESLAPIEPLCFGLYLLQQFVKAKKESDNIDTNNNLTEEEKEQKSEEIGNAFHDFLIENGLDILVKTERSYQESGIIGSFSAVISHMHTTISDFDEESENGMRIFGLLVSEVWSQKEKWLYYGSVLLYYLVIESKVSSRTREKFEDFIRLERYGEQFDRIIDYDKSEDGWFWNCFATDLKPIIQKIGEEHPELFEADDEHKEIGTESEDGDNNQEQKEAQTSESSAGHDESYDQDSKKKEQSKYKLNYTDEEWDSLSKFSQKEAYYEATNLDKYNNPSREQIEKLFNILVNWCFIDDTQENLNLLACRITGKKIIEEKDLKPIEWKVDNRKSLSYFIHRLAAVGFDTAGFFKRSENFFIYFNGNPFVSEGAGAYAGQYIKNPNTEFEKDLDGVLKVKREKKKKKK